MAGGAGGSETGAEAASGWVLGDGMEEARVMGGEMARVMGGFAG